MVRARRFLLASGALLLMTLASCASSNLRHATTTPSLQTVSFRRTGGLMAVNDHLTIEPDGHADIVERDGRIRTKQLSQEQIDYLIKLFEGWKKLDSSYPTPKGAADYFEYEVEYDGKTVRGTDASTDAPKQLREIWGNLSAIVH